MGDFSSNKAAWLIAGFLGRKFMRDMLGRWSFIPVLAIGLCVWTRWITHQHEGKLEQGKLEELRRKTKKQLRVLRKKTAAGLLPSSSSKVFQNSPSSTATIVTPTSSLSEQKRQRRPGDRLGDIPSAMQSVTCSNREKHLSAIEANGIDSSAPKDALAAELWAWLGGVRAGRACGANRSTRSSAATVGGEGVEGGRDAAGGGGGEWRGAFTNRMGNLPRRISFKTARGKVYLRNGSRGSGWTRKGQPQPSVSVLESVREEEDEMNVAP